LATVYFPGELSLRGLNFDMQRGIYPSFSGTAGNEVAKQASNSSAARYLPVIPKPLYQGKQVIGFTGLWTGGDDD
jgi:hypothetical protein